MAITSKGHEKDLLLVALVPILWGLNFPATAIALRHFPPLLAAALRFAILCIPAALFFPRPKVELKWLVGTGFGLGLMQFAFLYLGMHAGMPSGLASIVLQASAPFTLILSSVFLHETLGRRQVIGVGIAVIGLTLIAVHKSQDAALLPVVLTLLGALGWAIGNICSRKARAPRPLDLTMWMSFIPPIPLFLLSLAIDGPTADRQALETVFTRQALPSVLGLLYIVVFASIVGYGIWNTLMSRHKASDVAPWSMLVPVIGVLSSWAVFGEKPTLAELLAGLLVVGGVLFATLSPSRS